MRNLFNAVFKALDRVQKLRLLTFHKFMRCFSLLIIVFKQGLNSPAPLNVQTIQTQCY